RLEPEGRACAGGAGEAKLLLGLLHAAEPEQAEAEVEAHALVAGVPLGERAELRERPRRVPLVEARDGDGHAPLDPAHALELAQRGELAPEPLKGDAVE